MSRDKEEQRKSIGFQVILNRDPLKDNSGRTSCRQRLILKSSNGITPSCCHHNEFRRHPEDSVDIRLQGPFWALILPESKDEFCVLQFVQPLPLSLLR